jgi:hypothetical protein
MNDNPFVSLLNNLMAFSGSVPSCATWHSLGIIRVVFFYGIGTCSSRYGVLRDLLTHCFLLQSPAADQSGSLIWGKQSIGYMLGNASYKLLIFMAGTCRIMKTKGVGIRVDWRVFL